MPTDRVENLKLDAEIPQQPSVLEDELPPDDSDEDEIDRSIADKMQQNEKRKRAPSISFAREGKQAHLKDFYIKFGVPSVSFHRENI